jgi:hypothetical protein
VLAGRDAYLKVAPPDTSTHNVHLLTWRLFTSMTPRDGADIRLVTRGIAYVPAWIELGLLAVTRGRSMC